MATFYSPKGRRNSYKTAYVPSRAHKVQLKVSTFNWIVVLGVKKSALLFWGSNALIGDLKLFGGHFLAQTLIHGLLNGTDDVLVSGAAAQVTGQKLAELCIGVFLSAF